MYATRLFGQKQDKTAKSDNGGIRTFAGVAFLADQPSTEPQGRYRALLLQAPRALRGSLQLPLEALQAGADLQGRRAPRIHPEWLDGDAPGPALAERRFDLVLLPAIWGNPGTAIRAIPQLPRWLRAWHGRGAVLLAIGTSVEWIAESGMLDGHTAIVHWSRAARFARRYPRVRLTEGRVLSPLPRVHLASSVDGALEAAVEVVRQLYSDQAAVEVARHFASRQPAGQGAGGEPALQDEALARLRAFVMEDLANPPTVADMARHLDVSTRTLRRHFAEQLRTSPVRWLRDIRLDRARQLLRQTNLQIEEIAAAVGYDDPSYFARQCRRWLGATPSGMRRQTQ